MNKKEKQGSINNRPYNKRTEKFYSVLFSHFIPVWVGALRAAVTFRSEEHTAAFTPIFDFFADEFNAYAVFLSKAGNAKKILIHAAVYQLFGGSDIVGREVCTANYAFILHRLP